MKTRKHLSATALFRRVRDGFLKVTDTRIGDATIFMVDVLMSAFTSV